MLSSSHFLLTLEFRLFPLGRVLKRFNPHPKIGADVAEIGTGDLESTQS
jgi:hypothetical protein